MAVSVATVQQKQEIILSDAQNSIADSFNESAEMMVKLFKTCIRCSPKILSDELAKCDFIWNQNRYTSYLGKEEFFIVGGTIGQGAQSEVYSAVRIALDGTSKRNCVLKCSRKSFKEEAERLLELSPNSKSSLHIDHFQGIYTLKNSVSQRYIGVFEKSSSDFLGIRYNNIFQPVTFGLQQLISAVTGVASFHRADLILRDIKGSNFLANPQQFEQIDLPSGKVTDFGLVRKYDPQVSKHRTSCTPCYAAPYIWQHLVDQISFDGLQGKASDVFSIGRTIHLDLVVRLLTSLSQQHGVRGVQKVAKHVLCPQTIVLYPPFTETLQVYEAIKKDYLFCVPSNSNFMQVYMFDSEQTVYENAVALIQLLEEHMDQVEYTKLLALAELAKNLQVTKKEDLLAFLGVNEENHSDVLIQKVLEKLQEIQTNSDPVVKNLLDDFSAVETSSDGMDGAEPRPIKRERIGD